MPIRGRFVLALALALPLAAQPDPAMLRRLFEDALARCHRDYGSSDAHTAQAARDLGQFLARLGEASAARSALSEAVQIDEAALGSSARQSLADLADLAAVSPPAIARPLWLRAAASPDSTLAARALAALGDLHLDAGDAAAAAAFYRRALTAEEAVAGPNAQPVSVRLNALAQAVAPEDAIPLLERALAIDRRALGQRHPQAASTEAELAGRLAVTGRFTEAIRAGSEALSIFQETLGAGHPRCAVTASIVAYSMAASGNRAGAEKMYRLALSIDERAFGPSDPRTAADRRKLDDFLREHP